MGRYRRIDVSLDELLNPFLDGPVEFYLALRNGRGRRVGVAQDQARRFRIPGQVENRTSQVVQAVRGDRDRQPFMLLDVVLFADIA